MNSRWPLLFQIRDGCLTQVCQIRPIQFGPLGLLMSSWSFRQLKHWILSTRDNFICSKGYFFSSIFGHKAGTYYFGQINTFIKTPWTKIFAQYFRFYRQSKDGATILEELDQIRSDRSSVWYVMLGFHKNSIKPYKRGIHEIVFFQFFSISATS